MKLAGIVPRSKGVESCLYEGFGDRRRTDLLNSPVSNSVFRFATVSGRSIQWFLKRNCSVTPGQLGWLYASLCVVSLGIGTLFWLHGAPMVLPFAWLELAAVGFAFMVYARHATDGEKIALQEGRLVVELENGGHYERTEFLPHQVRIEPQTGDRSLIEVSGQGRSVRVGRYVRPELRAALAREIRMALRGA
ncbi:UNVERIFIED_ORG: putative membrane protein [Variovorax paradoxus]|nr:putative membrane protein [Variovorax paradoxus]